jgi:hypothetical protein
VLPPLPTPPLPPSPAHQLHAHLCASHPIEFWLFSLEFLRVRMHSLSQSSLSAVCHYRLPSPLPPSHISPHTVRSMRLALSQASTITELSSSVVAGDNALSTGLSSLADAAAMADDVENTYLTITAAQSTYATQATLNSNYPTNTAVIAMADSVREYASNIVEVNKNLSSIPSSPSHLPFFSWGSINISPHPISPLAFVYLLYHVHIRSTRSTSHIHTPSQKLEAACIARSTAAAHNEFLTSLAHHPPSPPFPPPPLPPTSHSCRLSPTSL